MGLCRPGFRGHGHNGLYVRLKGRNDFRQTMVADFANVDHQAVRILCGLLADRSAVIAVAGGRNGGTGVCIAAGAGIPLFAGLGTGGLGPG